MFVCVCVCVVSLSQPSSRGLDYLRCSVSEIKQNVYMYNKRKEKVFSFPDTVTVQCVPPKKGLKLNVGTKIRHCSNLFHKR